MTDNTWKQVRRTTLLVWGLAMASYLIVVTGATADVAAGLISAVIAGFGARFIE